MHISTASTESPKEDMSLKNPSSEGSYTDVMLRRWEAHNQYIPTIDTNDIQNDNPNILGKSVTKENVNQHAPEYA